MTPAQIMAKVNKGYAIAAKKVGFPFSQYRPTDPLAPLATPLSTLSAAFDTNGRFNAPNGYGHPTWRGYFDGSRTLPGDYLVEVSPTQTGQDARIFFIAAQQPLLPILAVDCNTTVSILRPTSAFSAGAQAGTFSGDKKSSEQPIITGWPASLLQGTKGERPEIPIPGDVRSAWYAVLVPALAGVRILPNDVLTSDGHRYKVSSIEKTDLGFRLSAAYAGT
jgi:hypothetical protein